MNRAVILFCLLLLLQDGKAADQVSQPELVQAVQLYELAIQEYRQDRDVAKARQRLLGCVKLHDRLPLAYYQLAMLEEVEHHWSEALEWYDRLLTFDDKSKFARQVKARMEQLRAAIQFEQTSVGQKYTKGRDFEDQAREAARKRQWQKQLSLAQQADAECPGNLSAKLLCVAALGELGRFDEAHKILRTVLADARDDQVEKIKAAALECRKQVAIDKELTIALRHEDELRYGDAGDGYAKVWDLDSARYPIAVRAIRCYVRAGYYTKAIDLLSRVQKTNPAREQLPKDMQDMAGLASKLEKLQQAKSSAPLIEKKT